MNIGNDDNPHRASIPVRWSVTYHSAGLIFLGAV
jgi:hypothetical protein